MLNKTIRSIAKKFLTRQVCLLGHQRRSTTNLQTATQQGRSYLEEDHDIPFSCLVSSRQHDPGSFNPFIPKCVILDKDGTLVCFHTMWAPWCTSLAERMSLQAGQNDLTEHIYGVLGYNQEEQKIRIGPLAENTNLQIRNKLEAMLEEERGFDADAAKDLVDKTWQDTPENMKIKLTGDLHTSFGRLKHNGIKIAICTSDSQEGTNEFLQKENLHSYIDLVVCGDDKYSKPKPDPHNAFYICEKLGVKPSDTVMVGDTPADTLMGQQARLGLTVGVLSGVGDVEDLSDADVIVPSIDECIEMIIPPAVVDSNKMKSHHITNTGLINKVFIGSQIFIKPSKNSINARYKKKSSIYDQTIIPPYFFDTNYYNTATLPN